VGFDDAYSDTQCFSKVTDVSAYQRDERLTKLDQPERLSVMELEQQRVP
jgi:hypothetical protein